MHCYYRAHGKADAAAEACKRSDVVRTCTGERALRPHVVCHLMHAAVASGSVTAREQDSSLVAMNICSYAVGQKPAAPD